MELTCVPATEAHLAALAQVQVASWQAAYRHIFPAYFMRAFTEKSRRAKFRAAMRTGIGDEFLLFTVAGQPAGMAIVGRERDNERDRFCGEVEAIYMHPDFWGRGIAADAMGYCLARLKERNFTRAVVWVLEKNARARRFYEKTGFALVPGAQKTLEIGEEIFALVQYEIKL